MQKFIDLSVVLNENTPVYPGDPKFTAKLAGILEKDRYEDHIISFGTHNGTHIDAPRHMIPNGKSLNEILLEKFTGNGICINVSNGFNLKACSNASINQNDIVFFYTGMSDVFYKSEYYDNYPEITEEIANYLVSKKIKMIGVDMCSPDHKPFPVHKILLSNDILIIENLTNLKELVGKRFRVYAFPLKLDIEASPVRVIAELKDNS